MSFLSSTLLIIAIISVLALIIVGYIWDYKQNPKEFKSVFKDFAIIIVLTLFIVFLSRLIDQSTPIKTNHGVEFNSKRKELGLNELPEDWVLKSNRKKFYKVYEIDSYYYLKGHHTKNLHYNKFTIEKEEDLFRINSDSTLKSVYHYKSKEFDCYLLTYQKTASITKEEFDGHLAKIQD